MQYLRCGDNPLKILPALPAGLQKLECFNNQLIYLPNLPPNLQLLECGGNLLTNLPDLPFGLKDLWCLDNKLTNLPNLPVSLKRLNCSNNFLNFADLEAITLNNNYVTSSQNYKISPATLSLTNGSTLTINGSIGGSFNVYKWYKDNVLIPDANTAIYTKKGITSADAGVYKCGVTSTYVGAGTTGVIIVSNDIIVKISEK